MTNLSTRAERGDDAGELLRGTPLGESMADWYCSREKFWGTVSQLILCAKCGRHEIKRHDEPRHYFGIFTPFMHTVCDECYEGLPE